jgi:FkbH-like protein
MNYIFRNYTIENLFGAEYHFSGYGDIVNPPKNYNNYIIFYQLNPSAIPEDQINEIDEIKSKINFILTQLNEKKIIVINLYEEATKDWLLKNAELYLAIKNFNSYLNELSKDKINVKILDINRFYQSVSRPFVDWKFFLSSQMVLNPKLAKKFKNWFNLSLNALNLKRKKCIVLDCDNTLWGGVVGEEGTQGIKLGQDYPGLCFLLFQKHLEMLSRKGIILTVCSKNNLIDVQDVWRNNPNQIITDKVLSAYRINWQDKASNIKSLAEELNIGLDSFVFIDDNPVERGLIKELLPEVEVPDFPEKAYDLVDFFWEIYHNHFSIYELSSEDLLKTEQYKENFFRNESKKSFEDIDTYLGSLDIQIDIFQANENNIMRIAQMTQKTNQFNLTTKRYTEVDLRNLLSEGSKIYCANVKDKFGDNGITIVCIIKDLDDSFTIDSYLLSCRILGRDIEKVTLIKIIEEVLKESPKAVKAKFIPTKKNIMCAEFLDNVGFRLLNVNEDGTKDYIFDKKFPSIKDFYKVNFLK